MVDLNKKIYFLRTEVNKIDEILNNSKCPIKTPSIVCTASDLKLLKVLTCMFCIGKRFV